MTLRPAHEPVRPRPPAGFAVPVPKPLAPPVGAVSPVAVRAGCEFGLTALLLFLVVTAVRWLVGTGSPVAVVFGPPLATAVLGLVTGGLLTVLMVSSPGRCSGCHLNPAVTLALWRLGAFPGRDVAPYAVAQLAGSLAGAWSAGALWGPAATGDPVRSASVRPDPAWSDAAVLGAEAVVLVGVTVMLAVFLSRPVGSRGLPYAVGVTTAVVIAVLGRSSGGSANPARQFGPAVLAGDVDRLWVYLLGPVLGAVLGAVLVDAVRCRRRSGAAPWAGAGPWTRVGPWAGFGPWSGVSPWAGLLRRSPLRRRCARGDGSPRR
ncbi:MIP/aquaporin family protein [Streptomyces sp. NPDC055107]